MAGNRRLTLDERLWDRLVIDKVTGCIIWTGAKTPAGYGLISYEGKVVYVHRLVYKLLVGDVPEGMQLDHGEVCSNHACANPEHVEVVTLAENVRRAAANRAEARTEPYKTTSAARARNKRYHERRRAKMLSGSKEGN